MSKRVVALAVMAAFLAGCTAAGDVQAAPEEQAPLVVEEIRPIDNDPAVVPTCNREE